MMSLAVLAFTAMLITIIARGEAIAERRYRHRCAGLLSLAATRADSLRIAEDGCAVYLGEDLEP